MMAGASRRARRSMKPQKEKVPRACSARISEVIRKPEMTKNTSTPTKPPVQPGTPAWKANTGTIATARNPSMSGR